jgi:hypothetical protein
VGNSLPTRNVKDDFTLELWFDDGAHRLFDVRPYPERGVFARLKGPATFRRAYVAFDTVCWPGDIDIAPETLYDCSVPLAD